METTTLGTMLSILEDQESLVLGGLAQRQGMHHVTWRRFWLHEAGPWAEPSNPFLGLLLWSMRQLTSWTSCQRPTVYWSHQTPAVMPSSLWVMEGMKTPINTRACGPSDIALCFTAEVFFKLSFHLGQGCVQMAGTIPKASGQKVWDGGG